MKKAFLLICTITFSLIALTSCSKDVKQPSVKTVSNEATNKNTKTITSSTNQNTNTQTQTGHTCGSHNTGQYHGSNEAGH